ncbi:MAG: glutathione-disulfide reductase [Gammaproteobacteria bacterium]|nr:glutathione-disulfide reductase [Gammaproteobacteria bacterium]
MAAGREFDYDLFVIGGGSGGVRAARVAAGHGARVGIAEEYRFGGTCVIRGCVPKKLLVYASRFADEFEDAAGFGWSVGEPRFNWPGLIAAKDREIARLESVYRDNLQKAGVALHSTRAILRDAHTVHLPSEQRDVSAEKILIATGGQPVLDRRIPGIEHAITSNEIFHLERLPERIAVVGGGYIALEFACLLQGLGSAVTLVYRGEEILRGFDGDLRRHLHRALSARGVDVRVRSNVTRIDRGPRGLECELGDGTTLLADQVLYAIGRDPNTAGLGLEHAGVELGWNGHVVVDEYSRSSAPHIFAVGDVTDRVALTPVAIREGHAFADTEFGGRSAPVDHELIPTAVFTTPELGTVGLTETAARERCRAVDIYCSVFRPLKATLSGRNEPALVKLVVDADSGRVLGVHLLGPDAAEMIQLAAIPLRMGATKADFDATMAVHPTLAEELVTMRAPVQRVSETDGG